MSLYLGTNCISAGGSSAFKNNNIGEIIQSTIPLSDAGLHLLDGSLISGSGSYSDFVTYMAGLVSGHSELFTTEANWQTSNDNYGACDKFVYDSVNNTVRLPKRVTDHGVLIKSYSASTDWYRIYSDGWCEQGGMTDIIADYGTATVNLLKPFLNTNYTITKATLMPSTGDDNQWNNDTCIRYATRTNSSFQIYSRGAADNGRYVNWQACGYTDISDLQQTPVYEYIVIANSVKTPVEVDIDEVMTDLNGKVDIADLATCHVVVETYVNGSSWYRVYDDGWCEQGGIVKYTSDSLTTVNLLKTYTDTDYCVQITVAIVGSAAVNDSINAQRFSASNVTVSSFQVRGNGTNTYNRQSWFTAGYIR